MVNFDKINFFSKTFTFRTHETETTFWFSACTVIPHKTTNLQHVHFAYGYRQYKLTVKLEFSLFLWFNCSTNLITHIIAVMILNHLASGIR